MSIIEKLIAIYPAIAKGAIVEDPTAVKRAEQFNTALRTFLAAGVTLAVMNGWLPEGANVEQIVMVVSGLYVTLSSIWTLVSNIVSTTKLGLEPPK